MAARPIWRGQIRLALVSIPVEIYSATKSGAAIQFHQVHEPSGKRIKYENVVLRDALKAANKVGVGQLAMRGQEYVVALKPCGRGMLLETLRYADEVNKSTGFFRDIGDHKPDPDLLDIASMLIERKAGEFDPNEFHNRY